MSTTLFRVLLAVSAVGLPLCVVYYQPAKRLVAAMGLHPAAVICFVLLAIGVIWFADQRSVVKTGDERAKKEDTN